MIRARVHRHRERGVVIVWYALFLMLLLSFVAVGIDLAKLLATRTQLRNAADAAALAGASAMNPETGVIVPDAAIARAQQTASMNKAFVDGEAPIVLDAADVVVGANTCKVTVRRQDANSIVTYFANVLGIPSLQLTATATAKMDTSSSALCGITPLCVSHNAGDGFHVGQVYQLKYAGGSGVDGNYGGLTLPPCANIPAVCQGFAYDGASMYRCLLEHHDYCCEIKAGQSISTNPGNMSGPTKTAIQYLFNLDTVQQENITYSDYVSRGGNGSRVIVVAITTPPTTGSSPVTILQFGAFFLVNIPGNGGKNDVYGEFIYATIPGSGSGHGPGTVTFALRLIQ